MLYIHANAWRNQLIGNGRDLTDNVEATKQPIEFSLLEPCGDSHTGLSVYFDNP